MYLKPLRIELDGATLLCQRSSALQYLVMDIGLGMKRRYDALAAGLPPVPDKPAEGEDHTAYDKAIEEHQIADGGAVSLEVTAQFLKLLACEPPAFVGWEGPADAFDVAALDRKLSPDEKVRVYRALRDDCFSGPLEDAAAEVAEADPTAPPNSAEESSCGPGASASSKEPESICPAPSDASLTISN